MLGLRNLGGCRGTAVLAGKLVCPFIEGLQVRSSALGDGGAFSEFLEVSVFLAVVGGLLGRTTGDLKMRTLDSQSVLDGGKTDRGWKDDISLEVRGSAFTGFAAEHQIFGRLGGEPEGGNIVFNVVVERKTPMFSTRHGWRVQARLCVLCAGLDGSGLVILAAHQRSIILRSLGVSQFLICQPV